MNQATALEVLKTGHNVYLTGPAGTGKTYVLNRYLEFLRKQKIPVAVTASTGLAASHLDGLTIHSWAGIRVDKYLSDKEILNRIKSGGELEYRLVNTRVLVVDEVSMLHSYRLDLIDRVCRLARRNELPYGGMQVVFSGDFFQLPPVNENEELAGTLLEIPRGDKTSDLAVHAVVWRKLDLKICYLTEPFRQEDTAFLELLESIRHNAVPEVLRRQLEARLHRPVEGVPKPTRLFTHNADVDGINQRELDGLPYRPLSFEMREEGSRKLVDQLKKSALAKETLELKKEAQVMFIRNKPDAGYVNGTLGKVIGFDEDEMWPLVRTLAGRNILATPEHWVVHDGRRVLASISQVPLRLAWAITVHKSQGMSLDAADIDLSKSFERGMGYVALSRVRRLDGITLRGFNEQALKVSEEAARLDITFRRLSEVVERAMRSQFSETDKKALSKK